MALETIEGVYGNVLAYHYDAFADVLYVSVAGAEETEAYGEQDERGLHVMRSLVDDRLVGVTVLSFWRRFGDGDRAGITEAALESRLGTVVAPYEQELLAA